LTAIIGAPYFAGYLLETSMLKETGIVGYVEPLMSPYVTMNVLGPAFFFSVLIGVLLFLNRQSKLYVSASIQQTILSLLVIYFLLQYVSSLVSLALIGRVVSPFTPSRFLSDCVTLLSVFSALLFFQLKTWLGKSKVWIASLIVAGFVLNWPIYRETFHGIIPEERLQAYEWIRTKTPADTIIIDDAIQTSYLTQRISSSMPIPTSEFLDMATNQKMTREINQGKIPPAAQQRQILFVTKGSPPAFAAGREVWSHPSGLHIIGVQLDETVK
jgi:hypothetical protein